MTKVLVIDGPSRGEVYDVEGHTFNAISPSSSLMGQLNQVVYYVHRFRILGAELRLASIHIDPSDLTGFQSAMIIDMILSDKAKEATI